MDFIKKLFNVENKVVVITGATGQLGNTICQAFKKAGAKVVGIDLNIEDNRIGGVEYLKVDITKKNKVLDSFTKIIKKYKSLDILINNAGVSTFEPFEERTEEKVDWVMDVNLKGTFFCIQCYVNLFDKFKLKKGVIINIASVYGVVSPDFRIYTDGDRKSSEIYGATKAAIIQMTKYFAVHLADRNIRVNAISPGGIFNPKNPQGDDFIKNYSAKCPLKRMANTEDLIGGILYLSSDASKYVTGHNLVIDGGMSIW